MDYMLGSPPDFTVIAWTQGGEQQWPVIGWDYVVQGPPAPITPNGKIILQYAIIYPDGRVYSRQSARVFEGLDAFRTEEGFNARVRNVDAPSPSLRSLGVSGRACAPLEKLGIESIADLACYERSRIAEIRGISVESMARFDAALEANGLRWGQDAMVMTPRQPEFDFDPDEMEDVL